MIPYPINLSEKNELKNSAATIEEKNTAKRSIIEIIVSATTKVKILLSLQTKSICKNSPLSSMYFFRSKRME